MGVAGLVWLWSGASWKRAFALGWFAGTIFFCISFSWFGYTVGSFVGGFAWALVLVPAAVEALAFALTGALSALIYARAHPFLAPLGAAAAFALLEALRSLGILGVPFAQIGYSQADTPLAVFAAYVGTFGTTFVVCAIGAYFAQAVRLRSNGVLAYAVGAFLAIWVLCWVGWPARHAAPPSFRVTAVQGNIAQSIKWDKGTLATSVQRYTALTQRAASFHPQLIVWPETVMTTNLASNRPLSQKLGAFARSLNVTLVTGATDSHDGAFFNASFIYDSSGEVTGVYDKRQLVPFVEGFPAKQYLSWLPYSNLITGFGYGHTNGVYDAGSLRFAPLICWESAFADLAHAQVAAGAQFFVVSTDDAWFGQSAGPYQHAQIAQMRAVENGMWVVRAASTGISGIIAPDGRYVESTGLDREAVVSGYVGSPPGSFFARIGPSPVILVLALIVAGSLYRRNAHA